MSEAPPNLDALSQEVEKLRTAITELAVVQAEALNAVSEHLRRDHHGPLASQLMGKPSGAWEAAQKTLDSAKRSIEIASRLIS